MRKCWLEVVGTHDKIFDLQIAVASPRMKRYGDHDSQNMKFRPYTFNSVIIKINDIQSTRTIFRRKFLEIGKQFSHKK